jgi:Zn-finger nucleic acid-binding protein
VKCPHCPAVQLVMADRQGIEIDYCPQCRGVWLDRGELDKLIERNSARDDRDYHFSSSGREKRPAPKRRGGLRELFDFD